ncbi:uncharacterized protein LOC135834513 [Planococcus citri]|uniref:uncharacterized protein LOC135834513 n=1 Tax=Planococcus citri TaxID=170843 RepID=UPI0031F78CF7
MNVCFPKLKQWWCCYPCPVRIGVNHICVIGFVWNFAHLIDGSSKKDPPDFLKFLDSLYSPSYSYGHNFVDYGQLYYVIQSFVMFIGICPGLVMESFSCLNPLAVSETLMVLMYLIKILTFVWLRLHFIQSTEDPVKLFILFALHYYFCSIIFSFFNQISKREYRREHEMPTCIEIITSMKEASSPSASAPRQNDQTLPDTPVFTQPDLSINPPNERSQTAIPLGFNMPQSVVVNESPPS